jgi:hypothetical protein
VNDPLVVALMTASTVNDADAVALTMAFAVKPPVIVAFRTASAVNEPETVTGGMARAREPVNPVLCGNARPKRAMA